MRAFVGLIGATNELLFCGFILWGIGSAMMNGIKESDMGKCMVGALICGFITTICFNSI